MTISLGALTFHKGMVWLNEFDDPKASVVARRTLGGGQNIQTASLTGGRKLQLSTADVDGTNKAYLTRAEVKQLKELERQAVSVQFDNGYEQFNVLVVPGSVKVKPLGSKAVLEDEDVYVGTLTLLEV
jgi:hypothetical protein